MNLNKSLVRKISLFLIVIVALLHSFTPLNVSASYECVHPSTSFYGQTKKVLSSKSCTSHKHCTIVTFAPYDVYKCDNCGTLIYLQQGSYDEHIITE